MSSHVAVHANTQVATTFTAKRRPIARHLVTAARILTGLSFLVFGLDGFLHFIPKPTSGIPEAAVAFGTALFQTGYMFQLIKGTEVVAAVLLLSNTTASRPCCADGGLKAGSFRSVVNSLEKSLAQRFAA